MLLLVVETTSNIRIKRHLLVSIVGCYGLMAMMMFHISRHKIEYGYGFQLLRTCGGSLFL